MHAPMVANAQRRVVSNNSGARHNLEQLFPANAIGITLPEKIGKTMNPTVAGGKRTLSSRRNCHADAFENVHQHESIRSRSHKSHFRLSSSRSHWLLLIGPHRCRRHRNDPSEDFVNRSQTERSRNGNTDYGKSSDMQRVVLSWGDDISACSTCNFVRIMKPRMSDQAGPSDPFAPWHKHDRASAIEN